MARKKYFLESLNLAAAQKRLVQAALAESQTITEAAEKMGITRHTLRRLMMKYGVEFTPVHSAYLNQGAAGTAHV